MNENERYRSLFDAIESDSEISVDTLTKRRKAKRAGRIKKAAYTFSALALFFLGSNMISYAKTGEFWVTSVLSFKTAGGAEITIEDQQIDENTWNSKVTFGDDYEKEFYEVEDGKLYFTYDGEKKDITAECDESRYFKHEFTDDNGLRHVLVVGGTVENPGSVEYIFDKDGRMFFSTSVGGVPFGDLNMVSQTINVSQNGDDLIVSTEEGFEVLKEDLQEYVISDEEMDKLIEEAPEWLKNAEKDLGVEY